jgi:hypothetical protein
MAQTRITFGEWLPDQPGLAGALTVAKNVYPKAVGYGPFSEAANYSESASEDLNNVVAAVDSTGSTKVFAGGATRLYLLDSIDNSLDDVSATTTGYTISDRWRFTQFGDALIAANGQNKLQYWDLSTSPATFQDLDASAPEAKFVTVVRDFVITGNQPSEKSKVQWSGINNPFTWTSSAATQSDFQIVPDGGEIRGITGGEFGLVLLERSIVRMSYVGTPFVFQFDNISRNLGCYEANSVVQWQGVTYFLSDDGFYACDGQTVVSIGAEKVNRFFFEDVQEDKIDLMSAAVDPIKNLVVWGYLSQEDTYRLLVFHTITKRWSIVDSSVSRIASSSTPSVTLEGLDVFSPSIDDLEVSLDARLWLGGKMVFAGVRGDRIITFSGPSKQAQIETPDLENEGQNTMITLAKPLVDGGSASVAVASRALLSQTPVFNTPVAADPENRVGLRSYGKYHRLRVRPSGENWTTAIGVDIELQSAGMR